MQHPLHRTAPSLFWRAILFSLLERKDIDPLMSEYDIKWLEKSTGGTDVKVNYFSRSFIDTLVKIKFSFTLNRSGNADALVFAEIKLDEDYPFSQPLIRYDLRVSYVLMILQ